MPNKPINKFNWEIPEYSKHERTKGWYIGASVVAGLLIIYCLFTFNFLFLFIIVITAIILILNDGRTEIIVDIKIDGTGVTVGRKFYDFDEIKNFSILYKPKEDIKNLYFEFKNPVKHRLSLYLDKQNPLLIREHLLQYLPEDLDRTDLPFSEGIAKIFKL